MYRIENYEIRHPYRYNNAITFKTTRHEKDNLDIDGSMDSTRLQSRQHSRYIRSAQRCDRNKNPARQTRKNHEGDRRNVHQRRKRLSLQRQGRGHTASLSDKSDTAIPMRSRKLSDANRDQFRARCGGKSGIGRFHRYTRRRV